MKIYIGTTKDKELVYLEWDKLDNEQRKTFSLSGGSLREPMTEEQGEERAEEYLEDGDMWKMEVNSGNTMLGLSDWKELVLNAGGWYSVLGDVENFGEHNNGTIYLNLSSCGQHKEEIKDFLNLWVSEEDLKEVYKLWENQHLKRLTKESFEIMNKFFEKYKSLCNEQEALNKYLKDIDY